ncbi:hypothetical protein DPMN_185065 [Dreissena polymorpha]|uniref:C2H2-type domain-containing protein n=1 Tax=Dreissena polymorpha TaxID=45954 RepID=A0A9D4DK86_DREPO|nr:hypothetical protein DPMN_185065 [Dreissena polymorpha]
MWRGDDRHTKFKCRTFGKAERRSRMVAHVLKFHVPLDRIPFSCSLCNFRYVEVNELVDHVRKYQRHLEEVKRLGIPDTKVVLNRSDRPININHYMEEVGEVEDPVDTNVLQATFQQPEATSSMEMYRLKVSKQWLTTEVTGSFGPSKPERSCRVAVHLLVTLARSAMQIWTGLRTKLVMSDQALLH